MTAMTQIKNYLATLPEGQAFSASSLRSFTTTENIRQILNRLTKAGELKRVARGLYVKPKQLATIGEILPPAAELAETLAKSTGENIMLHGAEAARQLQLTTQVPMKLIFYTTGNTRTLKLANRTIQLKHINPSRLIAPGTTAGLVITALNYLGRENVTLEILKMIQQRIGTEEFTAVLKLIERMPAWMADVFYRYQQKENNQSFFRRL